MPVPTDQLAEEIHELGVRLTARIDGLESGLRGLHEELAVFRERADTHLAFIKWLGVFLAMVLVASLAGAGRIIWDASKISTQNEAQSQRLAEVSGDVKRHGTAIEVMTVELKRHGVAIETMLGELKGHGQRLDKIEGRLDGVEKRLEKIDGRMDGTDQRLGAVEKRQERMSSQLDGIAKQLDVLIQRAGK